MSHETSELIEKVRQYLIDQQIAAYLVGGYVRDSLLNRTTSDIDITVGEDAFRICPALAEYLGAVVVPLDEVNRIVRLVIPGKGNTAQVYLDLSTMQTNIGADLARRDFTINAMAVDIWSFEAKPDKDSIIDPFNGQADLRNKVVRAVKEDVFISDPARLLRAFRIAAELGFKIELDTQALIKRNSGLISKVAGERIHEELLKLCSAYNCGDYIRLMDDLHLLTAVIPELEASRGVEQPVEHHWDVLQHSLESVRTAGAILHEGFCDYVPADIIEGIPWTTKISSHFRTRAGNGGTHSALFKLAALLHDIAKPETKILADERVRFFGHSEQGADQVVNLLERLRFSKPEIRLVENMVRYHMRPTQMANVGMPTARAVYRYFRDTGPAAVDILFLSLADHLAARGPNLDKEQWEWHLGQVKYILEQRQSQKTPARVTKLIDGHDLLNTFGLKPGPQIRKLLEAIKEAQAAGEIINRDEAFTYVKNQLIYKK